MCLCKCHHGNIEGSLKEFQNRWEECFGKQASLSFISLHSHFVNINGTAWNSKGTKGTKGWSYAFILKYFSFFPLHFISCILLFFFFCVPMCAAFICVTKLNRLCTNNKISQLGHSLTCYMMPGDSLLTHDMNVFEPHGAVQQSYYSCCTCSYALWDIQYSGLF